MGARGAVVAAAAVGAVCGAFAGPAEARRWLAPQRVAEGRPQDLSQNEHGDAVVTWRHKPGAYYAIAPRGRRFGAQRRVPGSGKALGVAAALDAARNVIVAFSFEYLARAPDGETDWWNGAEVSTIARDGRVTGPRRFSRYRSLDGPADVLAGAPGHAAVLAGYDDLAMFSRRLGAWDPRLEFKRGYIHGVTLRESGAAQIAYTGSDRRRLFVLERAANGRLGRPMLAARGPAEGVDVGTDRDGAAVALWWGGDRTYAERLAVATRAGGRFGPARDLEPARHGINSPLTALSVAPSGAAVVAWSRDNGRSGVVRALLRRPGAQFGRGSKLDGGARGVVDLQAAIDNAGRAVVVWRGRRPDGRHGVYAAVGRLGQGIKPAQLISGRRDGILRHPRVVMRPGGHALVVWSRDGVLEATRLVSG